MSNYAIKFQRLTTQSPLYEKAESLINRAFAEDERRHNTNERALTDQSAMFGMNAILCNGEWVGFVATWNFGKILYIEHLAIEDSERNKGIGSQVLEEIATQSKQPMLVEVEPEDFSDIAAKRINFYERAGFKLWATDYVQPAYSQDKNEVPMRLMGYNYEETQENIDIIIALLKKYVYKTA